MRTFVPVEEILRQWGRNLVAARKAHRPDGMPKARIDDGEPYLSQAALGQLLNPPVAQGTVAKWELGLREPRASYKRELARVLHQDVFQLFPLTRGAA